MFKFSDTEKKKYKKLCKAAGAGDLAAVKSLVEAGADVNGPHGLPLFSAAYAVNGAACVSYLLEKGARVDTRNQVNCTALMGAASQGLSENVKILLAAGADRGLRGRDRNALEWAKSPEVIVLLALPAPALPAPEPRVDGAHEVTFTRRLGNRVLEEVFDFAAHERITLVRKDEDGPVEAITRDGFSQVEDKNRLREAFAAYVKKGGSPDEGEFFPGTLAKPPAPKSAPGGA